MCDPVTIGYVAVGVIGGMAVGQAMAPKGGAAVAQPNPDAERAKAEAEAAQRANAQLATDQRRRREGGSLMARGAPQPTFGDKATSSSSDASLSPITGTRTTSRSTVARASSLMSRGAPPAVYGSAGDLGGGGGGRSNTRTSLL